MKRHLKPQPVADELPDIVKKRPKQKFPVAYTLLCLIIVGAVFIQRCMCTPRQHTPQQKIVPIPNVIGLDVEEAEELLKKVHIHTVRSYTYNKFFDNMSVMKMSLDPGSRVDQGAKITLYVCKDEKAEKVKKNEKIAFEGLPFRQNHILIESMEVKDGAIYIHAKNDTKDRVLSFGEITLGYWNAEGEKFLNKRSLIQCEEKILPQKEFTVVQKIRNPWIRKVTVERICGDWEELKEEKEEGKVES